MKSSELFKNAQDKVTKGKPTAEEKKLLEEKGVSKKDRKAYKQALVELRTEIAEQKALEEANKPKAETDTDVLKEIRDLLKK
jgi:DNA segregation ATPase FtsK/SpoIIIE-like protein